MLNTPTVIKYQGNEMISHLAFTLHTHTLPTCSLGCFRNSSSEVVLSLPLREAKSLLSMRMPFFPPDQYNLALIHFKKQLLSLLMNLSSLLTRPAGWPQDILFICHWK